VRLGQVQPDMPLIIADDIESAATASEITGLPAWTALSAAASSD
jgi:hypothetical protein